MPAKTQLEPIRLLRQRVQELFRHLPGAVFGAATDVHQMRVAARRLRVALGLLARHPKGARVRRARRGLQQLIRSAGLGRDLDVMQAGLEQVLADGPRPDPLQRRLLRSLRDARRRSRRQVGEALLDLDLAGLRKGLRALLARGGADLDESLVRLYDETERRRARLSARLAQSPAVFEAERLHGLRIGFRRLRYTAELLQTLGGLDGGQVAFLREQQQYLGRVHDLWVLSCWLRSRAERALARDQADLAGGALRLAEGIEARSREAHATWLFGRPAEQLEALRGFGPAGEALERLDG